MGSMELDSLTEDLLTGAYSRAGLEREFPAMVEHAVLAGSPLSVFVFDADHFKTINDAYGHARGDEVLREIARRVRGTIRPSDLLFRYGGDEFVVVLPDTNKACAAEIAQRMLSRVVAEPIRGEPEVSVSLSVGVASCPEDATEPRRLFEVADRRSYQAKRRGRAQVAVDHTEGTSWLPQNPSGRLIERDEALRRAQMVLQQSAQSERGALRLAGLRGSGRTRLLAEIAALGRLRNFTVISLAARSHELHVSDKYDPEGTVTIKHELAERREALTQAFGRALTQPERDGILVCIDDLPELDFGTFDWLRQLLVTPSSRPLVVAFSTDPVSARTLIQARLPLHASIEIGELSTAGVQLWLRNFLRWDPPLPFVDWLYEHTAGLVARLHEACVYLTERGVLRRQANGTWHIDPSYPSIPLDRRLGFARSSAAANLPAEVTRFVGRERELERIHELLDRSRLVTLKGPGGIGKTRLAVEVAGIRSGDFADGVWYVPLNGVTDPKLVPAAIAKTLGLREANGLDLAESMREFLSRKDCLLVLDNFEQVVDSAPLVVELLRTAPRLHVLVTSREALRVSGEQVYDVPPLELPVGARSVQSALQSSAVALFVSRAQAVREDFTLHPSMVPTVVELCSQLDALPLAIELAAARVDTMPPEQMLREKRELIWRMEGPRDSCERHRTIQDVIAWSYGLLSKSQQRLLARLGVFEDGFSAEAAAAISAGEDCSASPERLAQLVDKSLLHLSLVADRDGRFDMLRMVRDFALARLREAGEEEELCERHAVFFTSLAERAVPELRGGQQTTWLDLLDADHRNLQKSIEWALAHGRRELAARACAALSRFWEARGYWTIGRGWCERVIASPAPLANALLARVLSWAGRFASLQGDRGSALPLLERALELNQTTDDQVGLAMILRETAWLKQWLAVEHGESVELLKRSLEISRSLGDRHGEAAALSDLSRAASEFGDYERADRLAEESLALSRALGDAAGMGRALHQLAQVRRGEGRFADAMALLEENRSICQAVDDKRGIATSLLSAAELARSQGEHERASQLYEQHIALCRQLGDRASLARSLKDIGEIARYRGELERARGLYEESLAILRETSFQGDVPWVLRALAEVELSRGRVLKAEALFREGLALKRERNVPMYVMLTVGGLAAVAEQQGDLRRSAQLIGIADRFWETVAALVAIDDQADFRRRVERTRARLDPAEFEATRLQGRTMPLQDAVAYALDAGSERTALRGLS